MSVTATSSIQFFWQDQTVPPRFRTGVSLHSHTMCSEESLAMVPLYTAKVPYLGAAVRRQQAEYCRLNTKAFNFADAFWTPPLSPRQAYRLEEKQIRRQFKLPALVSLTDHDDIRAASMLHVMERFRKAPVSNEWTIPFGSTFFHLGVHNLPVSDANAICAQLAAFTANPQLERLGELLAMLNALPDVLLILNHPLWDEKGIGLPNHTATLQALLRSYGHHFHALELNGLRSWDENRRIMAIAREINLPIVSGGDRHGREANAILNLTRASTFADFIHEVRYQRISHVVFMPQYNEPLKLRILQTMVDVVRDYPENLQSRRTWGDRVFWRQPETGMTLPLNVVWKNDTGPAVVKHFITAMRFLEWRGVRSALKLALNDNGPICYDTEAAV